MRGIKIPPVLLIYNTETDKINYYDGTIWNELCGYPVSNAIGTVKNNANISFNLNGSLADSSAVLDISSSDKGILIPRLSENTRDYIYSPAEGLMVYNTTSKSINIYSGNEWLELNASAGLSAPTAGSHTASETQVTWNWNSVSSATGYKWNTIDDYNTATDNGNSTTLTQSGLTCQNSYTLYVWAFNDCGISTSVSFTQSTTSCPPITIFCGSIELMAVNLDTGIMINSTGAGSLQTNNGIVEKYCYNNIAANCDLYGGLYEWNETMGYAPSSAAEPSGIQGICPIGYHVPSHREFARFEHCVETTIAPVGSTPLATFQNNLGTVGTIAYAGSNDSKGPSYKMRSTTLWSNPGSNASGMNILPAGYRLGQNGGFGVMGIFTYIWLTTALDTNNAHGVYIPDNSKMAGRGATLKTHGLTVRCIKD